MDVAVRCLIIGPSGEIYRIGLQALNDLAHAPRCPRVTAFAGLHIRFAEIAVDTSDMRSLRIVGAKFGRLIFDATGAVDKQAMDAQSFRKMRAAEGLVIGRPLAELTPQPLLDDEADDAWTPTPDIEMRIVRVVMGRAKAKVLRIE